MEDNLIKPQIGEIYISTVNFSGRYIDIKKGDLIIPLKLNYEFKVIKLSHLNSNTEVSSEEDQGSVVLSRRRFINKQFVLLSEESSKEILEEFNSEIYKLTKKVMLIDSYLFIKE